MPERFMCPHCGIIFKSSDNNLIPTHDFPPPCRSVCPGTGQIPRNPDTDNRPLWKDAPLSPPQKIQETLKVLRQWAIGHRIEEIREKATEAGWICCVDAHPSRLNNDLHPRRFSVNVIEGRVVDVVSIG